MSRAGRRAGAALIFAASLGAPPARLAAQTVDTVIVENANIFEERDRSLIARWANALHITTSPSVIRRTLLLRAGEPYDSARAIESARALRALGVFRFVEVDTTRVATGLLALRVRTADGWSTQPEVGFAATDGDATWSVGFLERNLLGSATLLGVAYRHTPDRDGFELEFVNPNAVVRSGLLRGLYRRYSDGRRGEWTAGLPFRETRARWSLLTYGAAADERVLTFRGGALDTARHRDLTIVGLRGGIALTATTRDYVRLWVDALWRREDFSAVGDTAVPRSRFATVGGGVEIAHVRLKVLTQVNAYGRPEDFDLSQLLRLGVWAAPRAWGYPADRAGVGPEAAGQLSAVWRRGFALARAGGRGVIGPAGVDSGRVEAALTIVSQDLPRQTTVLHGEVVTARRPAPGGEYDLWLLERGPRLYGAHVFTGDRAAWVALEDRILVSDRWLGLVGVGVAPFAEWGGAWFGGDPRRAGANAGLALRLGSTRSTHGSVVELAAGWRFAGEGVEEGWAATIRSGVRW
jgi:hypothetical protein